MYKGQISGVSCSETNHLHGIFRHSEDTSHSQLWLHQGHKIEMLTFFFNLTLNSTLSFPPASLFVFCDLRCRRLERVAGTGNLSTALVEGEGDARRDGEGLTAFFRGGMANPSWGSLERSPVFELLLLNRSFGSRRSSSSQSRRPSIQQ